MEERTTPKRRKKCRRICKSSSKISRKRSARGMTRGSMPRSLWFLDQFAALNTELKKPEADLGLIAGVTAVIELAPDRFGE